jgi:hypothetical protein
VDGLLVATWLLGFALFLVGAKAHGRLVRLEREAAGVTHVDFRNRATNDPRAIAIWARDRWIFWITWVVAALALLALAYGEAWEPWTFAWMLFGSFTASFVVAGFASWWRAPRPRAEQRATLGYAVAVVALALAWVLVRFLDVLSV